MADEAAVIAALKELSEGYPDLTFTKANLDRYVLWLSPFPTNAVLLAIASWTEEDNAFFPKGPQLVARAKSAAGTRRPPERPRHLPQRGTIVTGLQAGIHQPLPPSERPKELQPTAGTPDRSNRP